MVGPIRGRQPLTEADPDKGTSKGGVVMTTQMNDNRFDEAQLQEQFDATIEAKDRRSEEHTSELQSHA